MPYLDSVKIYADKENNRQISDATHAKQIYFQLLLTSQLLMSVGMQSKQTINALLKLNTLTTGQIGTINDINSVIGNALDKLQKYMCKLTAL